MREEVASGKLSADAAAKTFDQLGIPMDQRGLNPDQRSVEQQQLDAQFPPAKASDYVINYFTPGQAPPVMPKEVKAFDASGGYYQSHAAVQHHSTRSLVNSVEAVITATHKMNESELVAYGEREYEKLDQTYGPDLEAKLQSAARMIHELDAKQPGLKEFLNRRASGIMPWSRRC